MKKSKLTTFAEIATILSFAFLSFPVILEVMYNIDWYKIGLLLIFLFSIGYLLIMNFMEYKSLKKWIGYPDIANVEHKGYYNLSDMVENTTRRNLDDLERRVSEKIKEEIKRNPS